MVGPAGNLVQQPVLPVAPEVDEKKTKSQTALKKFNTMFKQRINAKRSLLNVAKDPKEEEKKPKKKTKSKEDRDIDFEDKNSDDEGIRSGSEKSDKSDERGGNES